MFFFNPEDLPEEMQEQLDRYKMEHSAHAHDISDFLHSLHEDQLKILRSILSMTESNYAAFVNGVITQLLHEKFGICMACSEKHDEHLAAMANGGKPDEISVTSEDKFFSDMSGEELLDRLPNEVLRKVDEYNLLLIEYQWPKVQCKGCGLDYKSLEDRMKKSVDGCHGCHEKSAWG